MRRWFESIIENCCDNCGTWSEGRDGQVTRHPKWKDDFVVKILYGVEAMCSIGALEKFVQVVRMYLYLWQSKDRFQVILGERYPVPSRDYHYCLAHP